MSGSGRAHGRHAGPRARFPPAGAAGGLVDIPHRLISALFDEVTWLVLIVLPMWALSLLAWRVSPWLLTALVTAALAWTIWSLRQAQVSAWTVLGMTVGLALLQLAPVLLMAAL